MKSKQHANSQDYIYRTTDLLDVGSGDKQQPGLKPEQQPEDLVALDELWEGKLMLMLILILIQTKKEWTKLQWLLVSKSLK